MPPDPIEKPKVSVEFAIDQIRKAQAEAMENLHASHVEQIRSVEQCGTDRSSTAYKERKELWGAVDELRDEISKIKEARNIEQGKQDVRENNAARMWAIIITAAGAIGATFFMWLYNALQNAGGTVG